MIRFAFYGTEAAIEVSNVGGSFVDFQTELYRGTEREVLARPPEDWQSGAINEWVDTLSHNKSYDPGIEQHLEVAHVLDTICHNPHAF